LKFKTEAQANKKMDEENQEPQPPPPPVETTDGALCQKYVESVKRAVDAGKSTIQAIDGTAMDGMERAKRIANEVQQGEELLQQSLLGGTSVAGLSAERKNLYEESVERAADAGKAAIEAIKGIAMDSMERTERIANEEQQGEELLQQRRF
jgi:uncharacterized protein YoxC